MGIETIRFEMKERKGERDVVNFDLQFIEKLLGARPVVCRAIRMYKPLEPAGNHYHRRVEELLVCVRGSVEFAMLRPHSKEREASILSCDSQRRVVEAVLIPSGWAHAVRIPSRPDATEAEILLFATGNLSEETERWEVFSEPGGL